MGATLLRYSAATIRARVQREALLDMRRQRVGHRLHGRLPFTSSTPKSGSGGRPSSGRTVRSPSGSQDSSSRRSPPAPPAPAHGCRPASRRYRRCGYRRPARSSARSAAPRPVAAASLVQDGSAVGQRQRQRVQPVRRVAGRRHPDERPAPQRDRRHAGGLLAPSDSKREVERAAPQPLAPVRTTARTARPPAPRDANRRSASAPAAGRRRRSRPACRAARCRRSAARGRSSSPRRSAPGSARARTSRYWPCGVSSTAPPLPRLSTGWPSASSSRFTCIDTADWVRPTRAAASVKLWPSAISTKARSRSGSRVVW